MVSKSVNVKDVDGTKFVVAFAAHLKKQGQLQLPRWVDLVKTGDHKELPPMNPDWFYLRVAAVARNVYLRPGTGTGALTHRYGGPKRLGFKPVHHSTGSPAIARKALQELERLGLVEKTKTGGRQVTKVGQKDLDRVAASCIIKA